MPDTVEPEIRSRIMASVKRRDTGPEVRLRKALHKLGYRYRLNVKNLPGSPDLVFPKYKAVIFVHGCFWHSHNCKFSTIPATRTDFWINKFISNRNRDRRKTDELLDQGWRVMIVWECAIKGKPSVVEDLASSVAAWLTSLQKTAEI